MIPALSELALDRTVRARAKTVYLLLLYRLDTVEWRELKHEYVARLTALDRADVARAFHELADAGYIEVEKGKGLARRYRLYLTRAPRAEEALPAAS